MSPAANSTPLLRTVLYGEKDGYLGRALSDSELAEECMGAMFGGTGTTANTFVYILWGVLQNPDIVTKLRKELRDAIPDSRCVPDFKSASALPYTQAVIKEAMRLYPTIVATLPRVAVRDTMVAGVPISKGSVVGTQNYTIHHNLDAFPDPERFLPERWLDKDLEDLRKEAFVPFSVGACRCMGINLAQLELAKLTAAFFRRFDASIDPIIRKGDMEMFDTFSASPRGGKLLIRLKEIDSQP